MSSATRDMRSISARRRRTTVKCSFKFPTNVLPQPRMYVLPRISATPPLSHRGPSHAVHANYACQRWQLNRSSYPCTSSPHRTLTPPPARLCVGRWAPSVPRVRAQRAHTRPAAVAPHACPPSAPPHSRAGRPCCVPHGERRGVPEAGEPPYTAAIARTFCALSPRTDRCKVHADIIGTINVSTSEARGTALL